MPINAWRTIVDHGGLNGLADDDHLQYHTDARGDARYERLGGGGEHLERDRPWVEAVGKPDKTIQAAIAAATGDTVPASMLANDSSIAGATGKDALDAIDVRLIALGG